MNSAKKGSLRKIISPKLKKYKWYEKIAKYLDIPRDEVIKSLGKRSGYTQEDKIDFSEKYDNGRRVINTINRKAEKEGKWIESWGSLKYVAIVQEFFGFQRIRLIKKKILPIIKKIKQSNKLKVLDYGCGTSVFGRLLLEKYPNTDLTLCDVDGYHFRFGLEECRKLNKLVKGVNIKSPKELPRFNDKFDFIYCFVVLEHIPNVFEIVKFLINTLRRGGIFLETYSGKTGERPHENSADSESAWDQRDVCFDYLYSLKDLIQITGKKLVKSRDNHYPKTNELRCWQCKSLD